MAGALSRRRGGRSEEAYWPGFVDAMAQLLLVITFLLSVFMVAQFLLAREITGQDSALGQLRSQIAELTQLLALETAAKKDIESSLVALQDDFAAEKTKNADLAAMLAEESAKGSSAGQAALGLQTSLDKEKEISFAGAGTGRAAETSRSPRCAASCRRPERALDYAETKNRASEAQIADLGKRLNSALAQRVQELTR